MSIPNELPDAANPYYGDKHLFAYIKELEARIEALESRPKITLDPAYGEARWGFPEGTEL